MYNMKYKIIPDEIPADIDKYASPEDIKVEATKLIDSYDYEQVIENGFLRTYIVSGDFRVYAEDVESILPADVTGES